MNATMTAWLEQGFVIRRGVLDPGRCQRLRILAEAVWAKCMRRDALSGHVGSGDSTVMFHPNHPDYFRDAPEDLRYLLESGAQKCMLDFVNELHGEEPLYYSNSLWFNPTSTSRDGNWHRDSQFVYPDEAQERALFPTMCEGTGNGVQIQIALVASDDAEYVPGSQKRWDTPDEYRIRRADGARNWLSNEMPGAVRISLQPGDAVALNPVGLHRGRYHVDKLRRTFTVTITKESRPEANSFNRQPWFLEPGYLDGLSPVASAWYQRFIAIYRPSWSQNVAPIDPNTGMTNAPAILPETAAIR